MIDTSLSSIDVVRVGPSVSRVNVEFIGDLCTEDSNKVTLHRQHDYIIVLLNIEIKNQIDNSEKST